MFTTIIRSLHLTQTKLIYSMESSIDSKTQSSIQDSCDYPKFDELMEKSENFGEILAKLQQSITLNSQTVFNTSKNEVIKTILMKTVTFLKNLLVIAAESIILLETNFSEFMDKEGLEEAKDVAEQGMKIAELVISEKDLPKNFLKYLLSPSILFIERIKYRLRKEKMAIYAVQKNEKNFYDSKKAHPGIELIENLVNLVDNLVVAATNFESVIQKCVNSLDYEVIKSSETSKYENSESLSLKPTKTEYFFNPLIDYIKSLDSSIEEKLFEQNLVISSECDAERSSDCVDGTSSFAGGNETFLENSGNKSEKPEREKTYFELITCFFRDFIENLRKLKERRKRRKTNKI